MADPATRTPAGLATPLWRALAVFRVASLAYAAVLMAADSRHYAHPAAGWPVLAAMAAWTAVATWAYARPPRRRWPVLSADVLVALACLVATRAVVDSAGIGADRPTLPMVWIACPVLAWAVAGGRRRGVLAALLLGAGDVVVRGRPGQATLTGTVLMLLAALGVGHVARLAAESQRRLCRATELAAATRERERLARGIHDSVLQVLALVRRRGTELGGPAAELGRLAGEQEVALRALLSTGAAVAPGRADLRTALNRYAGTRVSIATPATPVPVPAGVAEEIAAAVGSALSNVEVHVGPGAPAWVLLEESDEAITVTVRDDGPGIEPGRLAAAEAAGRLGVARSIRGRLADLGGVATLTSAPGEGTEVEMRIPRASLS